MAAGTGPARACNGASANAPAGAGSHSQQWSSPLCSRTSSMASSRDDGSAIRLAFDSSTRWPTSSSISAAQPLYGCGIRVSYAALLCRSRAVVGLEALCLAVAFIKFGRLPSYHSYLAKTWGLVLASALVVAFVTKHPADWIVASRSSLGALLESRRTDNVA